MQTQDADDNKKSQIMGQSEDLAKHVRKPTTSKGGIEKT